MTRAALALACLALGYSPPAAAAERIKIGGAGLEWESNALVFNALEVSAEGGLSPLEADPEENILRRSTGSIATIRAGSRADSTP